MREGINHVYLEATVFGFLEITNTVLTHDHLKTLEREVASLGDMSKPHSNFRL